MNDEADELMDALKKEGYKVVDLTGKGPLDPLVDIKEAIKDAPFHWP
jgi:hypothetical protein